MTQNLSIVEGAKALAHEAHDSIQQVRKWTGIEYWHHTDEVARIVSQVTDDVAVIAAAHLHDLAEDVTPENPFYSIGLIQERFGSRVSGFVLDLTDLYTKSAYPQWNRATRKRKECERLGLTAPESQTVKLADCISNTADIVKNDPQGFAVTYLREIRELLPFLYQGNMSLWIRATQQVNDACAELKID